jgi:hypothetical protein
MDPTKDGALEIILLPSTRRPGMAICNIYSMYNTTGVRVIRPHTENDMLYIEQVTVQ